MTVNFIQLEYFHKVMACGSVTRAARELFITQPAVSKQLKLLKQELAYGFSNAAGTGSNQLGPENFSTGAPVFCGRHSTIIRWNCSPSGKPLRNIPSCSLRATTQAK